MTEPVTELIQSRENLGLTQGQFASLIGVSRQTVIAWESGASQPHGTSLRILAATLLQSVPVVASWFEREPQAASGGK